MVYSTLVAAPAFSDFATRFSTQMLQAGKAGWCDRARARLRDFFSAFFEESAFRWFYIVAVVGTISGQCELTRVPSVCPLCALCLSLADYRRLCCGCAWLCCAVMGPFFFYFLQDCFPNG